MSKSNIYPLMGIKAFSNLEYNEFDIIGQIISTSTFKAGDVILKEGSHGNSMCFVAEGTLSVIKKKEDGHQALITTISTGEFVGEMALVVGLVRSATIQAKTDGILLTLKRIDFEKLIESHPKIGVKILKGILNLISVNLHKTSKKLTNMIPAIS